VGEAHPKAGWEDAEKPFADRAAKNFFQPFVPMIAGAEAIPVSDQKLLAIALKFFWFKINGNIQFLLKIIPHPHIMVAHK
jgi:hypothetical protein